MGTDGKRGPKMCGDARRRRRRADAHHFVLDVLLRSGEHFHRVLAQTLSSWCNFMMNLILLIIINAPHIPPRLRIPARDPEADEGFPEINCFHRFRRRARSRLQGLHAVSWAWAEQSIWSGIGGMMGIVSSVKELPKCCSLLDMTFPDFSLSLETGATLVCKTDDDATDDGIDSFDALMHRLR